MSRHELFNAYIAREINRRAFIQGLTALGVSTGVAASYAVALQPVAAAGGDLYDMYYDDDPNTPPAGSGNTPGDTGSGGKKKRKKRKKHKKKH